MNGRSNVLSDGRWYCKYCNRIVNRDRKLCHQMIKRHMYKARWHKYFEEVDRAVNVIKQQFNQGLITADEFNQMEQEVYKEADELDVEGYFCHLPDED